jgi:hypothetical protein
MAQVPVTGEVGSGVMPSGSLGTSGGLICAGVAANRVWCWGEDLTSSGHTWEMPAPMVLSLPDGP